jgi:sialic acid synthase SpsE
MRRLCRRSIIASCFIPRGAVIRKDMLLLKRPGTGLGPEFLKKIAGRRAKKDIKQDKLISLKDVTGFKD